MRRLLQGLFLIGIGLFLAGCTAVSDKAEGANGRFAFVPRSDKVGPLDIEGHRGARGLLPENTLPAVEAALDLGVTTIEADLHFTQDGQVVVWHDPIIMRDKCRLPEDTAVDIPDPKNPLRRIFISQQPLTVIQAYQCDQNPEPDRFPEQRPLTMPLASNDYGIATLTELFAFVSSYAQSDQKEDAQRQNASRVQFNIELKRDPAHPEYIDDGFTGGTAGPFELAVLAIVAAADLQDRVIIQSFDHQSLRTIREIDDAILLAALTTGGEDKIKVYNGYGFDIWSPNYRDLTPELLQKAHDVGLRVIPWTVNDTATMRQLIDMGVDGLISDRPDILLQLYYEVE